MSDLPYTFQAAVKALAEQQIKLKAEVFTAVRDEIAAGKIPLSKEANGLLSKLTVLDVVEILEEHPGFLFHDKIEALSTALRLFIQAEQDLARSLDAFHAYSLGPDFMNKRTAEVADNLETAVRKELFTFAALAHSIVDHARSLKQIHPPIYYRKLMEYFGTSGIHDFIAGLRNGLHHQRMLRASWVTTASRTEKTSRFTLKTRDLLRAHSWSAEAKHFMAQCGKEIDVGRVAKDYAPRVHGFYAWFIPAVEIEAGLSLLDYRACLRRRKGLAAVEVWRVLLDLAVRSKIDPYVHLQKILDVEQHKEALEFPSRSKAQVDFIISCIDEYDSCTEELRQMAYTLFAIGEA